MPLRRSSACRHISRIMEFKETYHPEAGEIKNRIVNYWTKRSHEFSDLREREQASETGHAWLTEILRHLPEDRSLNILNVGCGTGMFALMLSELGHHATGIDLTGHMVCHAQDLAKKHHSTAQFFCMDAENPDFPDQTFDVVLTRNLTWTLPHPDQAYRQWFRMLKSGGILLNFDADYGHDPCNKDSSALPASHAHRTMAQEMLNECETIKGQLSISQQSRPAWDQALLQENGYTDISSDTELSSRIYRDCNEFYNPTPMFAICAQRP